LDQGEDVLNVLKYPHQRNIAIDSGDGLYLKLGRVESKNERERIVDPRIAIDDNFLPHHWLLGEPGAKI
jgi:hypothetical protein